MNWQIREKELYAELIKAPKINRRTWQAMDVSQSPLHVTRELINVIIQHQLPAGQDRVQLLRDDFEPDLPWADEHFAERVSGQPLNPPPSHVRWPYHGSNTGRHLDDGVQFSHTYPERFWPKYAGHAGEPGPLNVHRGIRSSYGDLNGVINQLVNNPLTRQAYLPVWFPEDTGETVLRVPCTLGYHFMADDTGVLHGWYYLRSCDFTRHLHNDLYFATRLMLWVADQVALRSDNEIELNPQFLTVVISSLHLFEGDIRE